MAEKAIVNMELLMGNSSNQTEGFAVSMFDYQRVRLKKKVEGRELPNQSVDLAATMTLTHHHSVNLHVG